MAFRSRPVLRSTFFDLAGPSKSKHDLVRDASNAGVEDRPCVIVVRIAQYITLGFENESGRLDLALLSLRNVSLYD